MGAPIMITPQARRRITGAVQSLDPASQGRWTAWAQTFLPNQVQTDVPYDIALIALHALIEAERKIEAQLSQDSLDDDLEADLLNDLGYVQAIEAALRNEGAD